MADITYVVNGGLDIITNRIKGSGSEPAYTHWGTGTTAATPANTVLETPRAESRVLGTSSRQTTNTTNDTYRVTGTLTCASTSAAITEVGLFDAVTDGNMFLRGTFDAINLNVGDSIAWTINVVFDQG